MPNSAVAVFFLIFQMKSKSRLHNELINVTDTYLVRKSHPRNFETRPTFTGANSNHSISLYLKHSCKKNAADN